MEILWANFISLYKIRFEFLVENSISLAHMFTYTDTRICTYVDENCILYKSERTILKKHANISRHYINCFYKLCYFSPSFSE